MIRPRGPLGFVASVLALWIAGRSGVLYWLGGEDVLALAERASPGTGAEPDLRAPLRAPLTAAGHADAPRSHAMLSRPSAGGVGLAVAPAVEAPAPALGFALQAAPAAESAPECFLAPFPPAPPDRPQRQRRLHGSAWAFLREDGGGSLAGGGQLGGSQAGVRLSYALGAGARSGLAIFGRLSTPLRQPRGKEAALGIEWQPFEVAPVRLTAERRLGLDAGGRDAFAVGLVAGIDGVRLPARLRLDAYAQAGIVGARARDAYVEAAVRAERRLLSAGHLELSAGLGAWGGAQPGVERLDVGPMLGLRFRAGGQPLRLNLDCGIM